MVGGCTATTGCWLSKVAECLLAVGRHVPPTPLRITCHSKLHVLASRVVGIIELCCYQHKVIREKLISLHCVMRQVPGATATSGLSVCEYKEGTLVPLDRFEYRLWRTGLHGTLRHSSWDW
jgi:hypothetical protein